MHIDRTKMFLSICIILRGGRYMVVDAMIERSEWLHMRLLERISGLRRTKSFEDFAKKSNLFRGNLMLKTSSKMFKRRFASLVLIDISKNFEDIIHTYSELDMSKKEIIKQVNSNVIRFVDAMMNDGDYTPYLIRLISFIIAIENGLTTAEDFVKISADLIKSNDPDDYRIGIIGELLTCIFSSGDSHATIEGFDEDTTPEEIIRAIGTQLNIQLSKKHLDGPRIYEDFVLSKPIIKTDLKYCECMDEKSREDLRLGINAIRFFEFVYNTPKLTELCAKIA